MVSPLRLAPGQAASRRTSLRGGLAGAAEVEQTQPASPAPAKVSPTSTKRGQRLPNRRMPAAAASPARSAIGKKALTRAERRRLRELDGDLVSRSEDDVELLDAVEPVGFTAEAAATLTAAAEEADSKDL